MKPILFFYLEHCPYCREANRLLEQLLEAHPEYRTVPLTRIEEKRQAELANRYDYYYVPCFYVGPDKRHEGAVSYEKLEQVWRAAYEG